MSLGAGFSAWIGVTLSGPKFNFLFVLLASLAPGLAAFSLGGGVQNSLLFCFASFAAFFSDLGSGDRPRCAGADFDRWR